MLKIIKPDIINKTTNVISLGKIESKLVNIEDDLIDKNKKSNDCLTSGFWVNVDGELHYFKVPTYTQGYINELLGEKISLHFGLPTVNNKLAEGIINLNGQEVRIYGLLSKWARKPDYRYQTLADITYGEKSIINPSSFDYDDLSILGCFDKVYYGQPVCEQFRRLIVRDFFTQETDRLEQEILIATKDNEVELGYLSDYEYEWGDSLRSKYILFKYLKVDASNRKIISQIQDDPYFQQALQKALDINVIELLNQIKEESKINLIDYDMKGYQAKEEKMKNLIKSKKMLTDQK